MSSELSSNNTSAVLDTKLAEIVINLQLVNDGVRPSWLFASNVDVNSVSTLMNLLYPKLRISKTYMNQHWVYLNESEELKKAISVTLTTPNYDNIRGAALGYVFPSKMVPNFSKNLTPNLYVHYIAQLQDGSNVSLFTITSGRSDLGEITTRELQQLQTQFTQFSQCLSKIQVRFKLEIEAMWWEGETYIVKEFANSENKTSITT
jgi:hypothetical protein